MSPGKSTPIRPIGWKIRWDSEQSGESSKQSGEQWTIRWSALGFHCCLDRVSEASEETTQWTSKQDEKIGAVRRKDWSEGETIRLDSEETKRLELELLMRASHTHFRRCSGNDWVRRCFKSWWERLKVSRLAAATADSVLDAFHLLKKLL